MDVYPRTETNNLPHRGRGTAAAVDEERYSLTGPENLGEFVQTKDPLSGEPMACTYSPELSPHRFCVPPLISQGYALPASPEGKLFILAA